MAQVEQPKRVLQAGIVGCGRVADHHARAIKAAGARLAGVADVNLENARRLAQTHGVENAYGSVQELLQAHALDVVHVVTPPAYHYECAKTAIEYGCSVLVEKPMVYSAEQAADLYERAARNNVSVCPDFILMFHPKMQQVMRLLDSGRLGRALHVDSHLRIDPGVLQAAEIREAAGLHWSYKLPGGVLHNYITHPLYMALYFAGKLRGLTVSGRDFGILPQNLVDHLTVHIDGEKCSASIMLSFHVQPAIQDMRIYCEKGNVYINFDWQIATVETPAAMPRIVNRALGTYLDAARLSRESTGSIWEFVRHKIVPYAGLPGALPARRRHRRRTRALHGASGGVGPPTVQLALAAGLEVTGTAGSEAGSELVTAQGDVRVLDHHDPAHLEAALELAGGHGFDLIVEFLANANLGADLRALAPRGRVIVVGSRGPTQIDARDLMNAEGTILGMRLPNARPEEMEAARAAVDAGLQSGVLKPVVGRELPLEDAPRPHRLLMERPALGRLVLVP